MSETRTNELVNAKMQQCESTRRVKKRKKERDGSKN